MAGVLLRMGVPKEIKMRGLMGGWDGRIELIGYYGF